jgi:hypothetical protein
MAAAASAGAPRAIAAALRCGIVGALLGCGGGGGAPPPEAPPPRSAEALLLAAERDLDAGAANRALETLTPLLAATPASDAIACRGHLARTEALLHRRDLGAAAGALGRARAHLRLARTEAPLAAAQLGAEAARLDGDLALLAFDPQRARLHYETALRSERHLRTPRRTRFKLWLAAELLGDSDVAELRAAAVGEDAPHVLALAEHFGVLPPTVATVPPPARPVAVIAAPSIAIGAPLDLGAIAVKPRSAWAATPPDLSDTQPLARPFRITVHHTALPAPEPTPHAVGNAIRDIQTVHRRDEGYADIGYHFLIDPAGAVYEGRSLALQGAHAGNSALNAGNIGVALLGNFEQDPLPRAQAQALVDLLDALRDRFGIRVERIYGHAEIRRLGGLGVTACPGKAVEYVLSKYRLGSEW